MFKRSYRKKVKDSATGRWVEVMEKQAEDRALIRSQPEAIELRVVDNGDQGWKWLVFDYDPGMKRMTAGAVEGSIVPHGMESGFASKEEARSAGVAAIRRGGWKGPIMLKEPT